jgi:Uma2 family endonuclease
MNKIVDFDGIPYELARLDRTAMESLHASGVLDAIGPVELIDGVLVRMSPSLSPHGYAMAALCAALLPRLKNHFHVGADIGVFLEETTMRAPDISVVKKTARPGFLDVSDLVMAIEISATTLDEDLTRKGRQYAANGIPEYWVVDLEGRSVHVHRDPGSEDYGQIHIVPWTEAVTPLCAPEFAIVLQTVLDGIV